MYSPEVTSRIDTLRSFSRSRKLTLEEQTEAIALIRGTRVGASYASAGAKAKASAAKASKPNGDALLDSLLLDF